LCDAIDVGALCGLSQQAILIYSTCAVADSHLDEESTSMDQTNSASETFQSSSEMDVRENERHLLRTTNFWKYLTYRELYQDLKSSSAVDSFKMEPHFHSTLSASQQQQQQATSSTPIEIQQPTIDR
jgi:hypothetical protein